MRLLARAISLQGLFTLVIAFFAAVGCNQAPTKLRQPSVRQPSVAGQFYPADPDRLSQLVRSYLDQAKRVKGPPAEALLVPHAGYVYSGQVAADAFVQADPHFRRVFILTANHNGNARYNGISLDDHDLYHLPGTDIPVDQISRELLHDPLFLVSTPANSMHMVEVELPFLMELSRQSAGNGFEIVPMVLGRLSDQQINRIAQLLDQYGGEKPLYVFSLDLSHYFPYEQAVSLDRSCLDALLAKDRNRVRQCTTDSTDRNSLLLILLELARLRELEPELISYKNSGDVTGNKRRVVGYAAVAFRQSNGHLSAADKRQLLKLARTTLERFVNDGITYKPEEAEIGRFRHLLQRGASFVTLRKNGFLRGCIGSLKATRPLWLDIRDNTISAASSDPRFPPVAPAELSQITVEVSVLTEPRPLLVKQGAEVTELIRPGIDGVVLSFRGHRSTYLPEVWHDLPDPTEFLSRLCRKQGSPTSCWRNTEARFETYQTIHFGPG